MDAPLPLDPEHLNDIVIFDGVCNLCEASVNFIIDRDPAAVYRFVPSQSELGAALEQQFGINLTSLDTVVLIRDGRVLSESDAAVAIAREFAGPWRMLSALRWVPRPLRDWGYRLIARNRYALFGRKDVCMIPSPGIRDRFLEHVVDLEREGTVRG